MVDRATGEGRHAQSFIAVLGVSNSAFAEATGTQQWPDWIGSPGRAFGFFGGVTEVIVPDNLKGGVHQAHRSEPDLNPTYPDLASHYGVAVIPARVRRPRDKAKVEAGGQGVERWRLAALRHRIFFSRHELNGALGERRVRLNERPFNKLPGCRRALFDTLDKPALRPLPAQPYELAEGKKARGHLDSHLEIDGHDSSVPHALVKQPLEGRFTATPVACFHKGERVASQVRCVLKGRRKDSFIGQSKPDPPPPGGSSRSCNAGAIRNKPFAAVWASCAWARALATNAWRPPAAGR